MLHSEGFNDREVIASGDDKEKVRKEAKKKGVDKPLIVFIPPEKDDIGMVG